MVYMPHWPKTLGYKPGDFFLDRILLLLNRLGNPQKKLNAPIHVAGTNGKGSTVAFIRSILEKSGYSVNVFTSPHLVSFNERIVLSGEQISDDVLFRVLEECRLASGGLEITFFEGVTAAAFLAFSLYPADFNIIEVGMGGRLDATNVINPFVTVFTSISLDHVEYLGPCVEIIAKEKAGIMQNGVPCIISKQYDSVKYVLESHASEMGSPAYACGSEWNAVVRGDKLMFVDKNGGFDISKPKHLFGMHQIQNAGNAIAVCNVLSSRYGYDMCLDDISDGVRDAKWAGRLDLLGSGFLTRLFPAGFEVYMDGCHNVDGARVISEWCYSLGDVDVFAIIGLSRGKDMVGFFEELKGGIKFACLVCVKSEMRAELTSVLKGHADKVGVPSCEFDSITDAMFYLSKIVKSSSRKSVVLVCGSLFLAKDLSIENY